MSNTLVRLNLLPFLLFNYGRGLIKNRLLKDTIFVIYIIVSFRAWWVVSTAACIIKPDDKPSVIVLIVMSCLRTINYIFDVEKDYNEEFDREIRPEIRFIILSLITVGTFIYVYLS
jgi:hypothetical protein